ncbi:Ditrans,polycis-undecaprenyl-diphosphate synthase ((2E,6E)-farnesyl-diphosphate specific) [bioreactor metagenome]|uniref:Ditrans,polycis-undecaprenyl-diphosphate synthase ((2E,6E)-farnesyl-diphosphate specific) n=1 Tax=bioreactor metagenome TaxID=1076179 RepID=A0A645BYL8_9ZZZZ
MGFFKKKESNDTVDMERLPVHIAIIMDGNGRWAKKRKLPRPAGHSAGAETFKRTVIYCRDLGIQYLTVYAFSTENWKRPKQEVDVIFGLLNKYVDDLMIKLAGERVKVRFIGDKSYFDEKLQKKMEILENMDVPKASMLVNVAFNYGGRDEIVRAVRQIARQVKEYGLTEEAIDQEMIASNLYTAGIPDPDLVIRTSGEYRLSNFMLWQIAYSELYFDECLWPDYSPENVKKAICYYQNRDRRYGGI